MDKDVSFFLFLVLFFSIFLSCNTLLNFAARELLISQHSKGISNFYVINTGNLSLFESNDILQHIMVNAKYTIQLEHGQIGIKSLNEKRYNVVILVKNFEAFRTLFKKITSNQFIYDSIYLIVLTKGMIQETQEIFRMLWNIFIYNVDILVEEERFVSLLTFIPFKTGLCNDTTPKTINKFESGKWDSDVFFPNKFKNLHQCTIKIGTYAYEPIVTQIRLSDGSLQLVGSDVEMLKGISEVLNFKSDIYFNEEPDSYGVIYDNGTYTGLIKDTINGYYDMIFGFFFSSYNKCIHLSCSQPYFNVPLVLIIPPASLMTSFEKLFQSFSFIVWILLIITFLVGLFVIVIINKQSKVIQNFVFGHGIKMPTINLLSIVFGVSMYRLPGRNFARILLMLFVLFCLIQRNLYVGSLFRFMQSEDHHKELSSLNEIVEKGFDIFMYHSYKERLHYPEKVFKR